MNPDSTRDKSSRKLAAIMFTDIVGYSRMMSEDEALTLNLLQEYETIMAPIIESYNGKILKKMGDGLFCEFSSALEAVDCASQMHEALNTFNQSQKFKFLLTIRIGIHLGDVVMKGDDLYGEGVNVAARIEPIAPPGGICVSQSIYSVTSNISKYEFIPLGSRHLKNIRQMHNLYLVKTGYEIEKTPRGGSESFLIGQVIDNYEIVKVLGYGGMGTVFKAIDQNLEKEVALKLMDTRLANDKEFVTRFRTEGKSQALLQHPNIVTVHTLRITDAGMFIVMEYVEGETLTRRIQSRGAILWQETLPIFKQLISGIEHAHSKGVIHRDIKPSNVIIDVAGKVKITDFGLARVQHDFGMTKTGYSGGTFVYSAPEQIKDFKKADMRSDIYSIGMTYYEMLAGKLPFDATESDLSIQLKILEGKITPLNHINPNIPYELVRIVNKALHKEPDKRFQSTGEMLAALEKFEQQHQSTAFREPKRSRRKFHVPTFITLLSVLFILAIGYYLDLPKSIQQLFASSGKTGTLKIDSDPAGASVFMDDNRIGATPIEYPIRDDGDFNFRIEKSGYNVIDTTVSLTTTRSMSLALRLERKASESPGSIEPSDRTSSPAQTDRKDRRASQPEQPGEIAEERIVLGSIRVTSQPPGASIWLDGQRIDNAVTPHALENIEPGEHRLRLRKQGFEDYQARVRVNSDRTTEVHSALAEIPTKETIPSEPKEVEKEIVGSLRLDSNPPGASIRIDNTLITDMSTPATIPELKPGEYSIVLRKEGYQDFSTRVTIAGDKTSVVSERLIPLKGIVKILVRPWGSIFIDGDLKIKETNKQYEASLPVGSHRIRIENPHLGEWEKEVQIRSTAAQEFVVDFNQTYEVIITSEPNFGEIYVDGKATGEYTPKQTRLRAGKRTVEVRKEGYRSEKKVIHIDRAIQEPLHFVLKKSP